MPLFGQHHSSHPDHDRHALDVFRDDVVLGLSRPTKELPCKYFYDESGAELFEQICRLPEYYLTRAELALMIEHAAEMADLLGPRCLLVEYGCGSGAKARLLLDHLAEPVAYVPVDLAAESLRHTAETLATHYPQLAVLPVTADFSRTLKLPAVPGQVARRVVYFPGSTVGNFTPEETVNLLRQTARLCGRGGIMLLGADLKKDPVVLHQAYNDAQGVTAAFNLNLLHRINRELESDIQPDLFWHYAFYNPRHGRIEMHLVARADQTFHVTGTPFRVREGETIRTEYSHKYTLEDVRDLAQSAGFQVTRVWTDEGGQFSVQALTVAVS